MSTEYKLSYTAAQIDERLGKIDSMVKSVNNIEPDENGNVEIVVNNENVDLSGYATEQWVQNTYQPKGEYLTEHQDISGKLDADKLPEAINTALAQAKASGEFDGKDYVLIDTDKTEIAELAAELIDVPTKTSELENDSEFITAADIPESGVSIKLARALSGFFTDFQTLLTQLAYVGQDHIGSTLVSDAKTLVQILNDIPLTNLTATYSGGYVTIGTNLDDLHKYITVTGTYADGTVTTITDYELSGTIIDGESVLTITSGDVSTTVSVTGTPNTYLYSNGFEYEDITGGWVNEGNIAFVEQAPASKDNGMLSIAAANTGSQKNNAVNTYATKNTIDLTKYSKFVIDGEFTVSGANGSANVRATSTLNTSYDFTVAYEQSVVVFNAAKSTTTNDVFEVDLTTLDFSALDPSKVYLAMSAGIWAANTNASCNVRNIYLVPKVA